MILPESRVRLAVVPIPSTRPDGALFDSRNLPALLDFARLAEDLGVDDLAMSEHVVMAHRPDKYGPGSAPHRFDEPWPEPLTTLAAMAAVTRRVRVISTIVIAPLRPACCWPRPRRPSTRSRGDGS